jgi:hypothetical protein
MSRVVRRRLVTAGARASCLLLVLGMIASFHGCASEAVLRRSDPGFTVASLREGKLAVLGAVQVDEVTQARPPLIAALERVMAGSRPDIPLVRADQVHAALGDSATRLLLLGYQLRGRPDSLWLARAGRAVRGLARYGLLARVEATPVRYGTRVVSDSDPTSDSDREIRVASRDARVSVIIYDLTTLAPVYDTKLLGAADTAPNLKPPSADSLDAERPAIDAGRPIVFGSNGYPLPGPSDSPTDMGYPEPPSVARAAESAFLHFARLLPGDPSRPDSTASR